MPIDRSERQLQDRLEEVSRLLETHRVLESLTHRQEGPKRDLLEGLQHRQNLAELAKKVRGLHPADLAFIVEALPPDQRQLVWDQVAPPLRGQALVEMSDAVRQPLVDAMAHTDLVAALTGLDADDLRYLAEAVPADVIAEVSATLDAGDRSMLHAAVSYPDDSVGAVMNHEVVSARDTQVLSEVVAELRARGSLPEQTDAIFVVDARNVLRGSLPIDVLLLGDPSVPVASLVNADVVTFAPEAEAAQAARSFERYDLVSAPVVDDRGKLIGRLTVDVVMDVLREEAERRELSRAGLRGEEDMFASTWASARNRWPWLCVNLVTAFAASRVIGAFEHTISQLVALAALMPMVASVGGNTGNQTVALVVRGLALDQISAGARPAPGHQGAHHLGAQRRGVGRHHGPGRRHPLRQPVAGRGDDGRGAAEPGRGGAGGHRRAAAAAAPGPRSRAGRERAADVHHRQPRLLPVPGVGESISGVAHTTQAEGPVPSAT